MLGYLGFNKTRQITEQLDRLFVSRIESRFIWSVLLVVVIAIIFSAILNRLLLKPILSLRATTQRISEGELGATSDIKQRDELGELASDLNQLSQTLAQNRVARRQWVADISHELRTPVAILKGELEALEDGIRPLDKSALQSLSQESSRLGGLIDDLHQLAMADAGAMQLQASRFLMVDLIAAVQADNSNRLAQHNAEFKILNHCAEQELSADKQRLYQLFVNLLNNSLAYSDTPVTIEVEIKMNKHNHWQVCWSDSAPGVSAEALKKLFKRLYRVEGSRNRSSGGSGLGLSICKTIVESHGGEISATHSELGGVCIEIKLPADQR